MSAAELNTKKLITVNLPPLEDSEDEVSSVSPSSERREMAGEELSASWYFHSSNFALNSFDKEFSRTTRL